MPYCSEVESIRHRQWYESLSVLAIISREEVENLLRYFRTSSIVTEKQLDQAERNASTPKGKLKFLYFQVIAKVDTSVWARFLYALNEFIPSFYAVFANQRPNFQSKRPEARFEFIFPFF